MVCSASTNAQVSEAGLEPSPDSYSRDLSDVLCQSNFFQGRTRHHYTFLTSDINLIWGPLSAKIGVSLTILKGIRQWNEAF